MKRNRSMRYLLPPSSSLITTNHSKLHSTFVRHISSTPLISSSSASSGVGGTPYGTKQYGKKNVGTDKVNEPTDQQKGKESWPKKPAETAAQQKNSKDPQQADFAEEYSGISDARMINDVRKEPGKKSNA